MTPIKVGVIGVGYLGKIHAKIYANMPGVDLVGVADIAADAREQCASAHNCRAFADAAEMLGKVDAVSVVVPTCAHAKVSAPFLQNRVSVMLEKPIAPSAEAGARIIALAKQHGALLQIGHLERFNAGVMKLADLAADPRFIEVHRLGPFVARATDVDVIVDLMIHDIDIVLALVKSELVGVSASGLRVITDHVDIANVRLEFANGAVANATASRVSKRQFRRIRVFSDAHYLALNFSDQQIDEVRPGNADDAGFPRLIENRIQVEARQPLDAELAHFIDCVKTGNPPLVSGDAGLRAMQVADKVRAKIAESLRR